MNRVRLLAACAALALVAAACGDDDDDASGDTTPATVAAPMTAAAPAATAAAGDPTTAGTGDPATAAVEGSGVTGPPLPTGDVDPDVAADCESIFTAFSEGLTDPPDDPEVGDEISDEYKAFVQTVVDTFDDIDLSTGEVEDAVGAVEDFGNNVIDSDEWTDELQTEAEQAFTPLDEACASVFITQQTTG